MAATFDLASDYAGEHLRKLASDFDSPDVVVHTAALKPGNYPSSAYVKSNVLATANLLAALEEYPPRQIIYTSTLSVYGRPDANPVNESHPTRVDFAYAASKRWSEQLLEMFQHHSQVIILRLPSLYGAGQPDSLIDGLARLATKNDVIELFSQGEVVRDALHVDDVVNAVIRCIMTPPTERFCCFNLGCGEPITSREYAENLVEALGSSSQFSLVDRPSPQQFDLYADISKARQVIGFNPTDLKHSMQRYANELRAQS